MLIVGVSAFLLLAFPRAKSEFLVRTFYLLAQDQIDVYILNWAELLLFVGCTAFVVEGFLRRIEIAWQYSLRELLVFVTALAITVDVMVNEVRLCHQAQKMYEANPSYLTNYYYYGPPLYPLVNTIFCVPLAFGLLCIAYTAVWFGVLGLGRLCSSLGRLLGLTTPTPPLPPRSSPPR